MHAQERSKQASKVKRSILFGIAHLCCACICLVGTADEGKDNLM